MTTALAHPTPRATSGDPVDAAQMRRAFEGHYASIHPIICHIVRGNGLPDEDNVIGDIAEHLWCQFPSRYQEEQEDLAAGNPSRHNWIPLLCEIARNRMCDHLRFHGLTRPKRAGQTPVPEDGQSTSRKRASTRRGREVPLQFAERLPAPADSDPAVLVQQREDRTDHSFLRADQRALLPQALAYLESVEPDQFNALQTSLHDVPDEEAASLLQTDRFTMYRRRRAAIRTLRRFYALHGFAVPTSEPRSRI